MLFSIFLRLSHVGMGDFPERYMGNNIPNSIVDMKENK